VRRLFSTYAHGPAGLGLLLIRLVAGITVLTHAVTALRAGAHGGAGLLNLLSAGLGILLLMGLWTPIAAALIALISLGNALWHPEDWWYCVMVGVLSLALALLGPGAFSVDARLFGWKRLEIPDSRNPDPPSD
jgi:uncharacterized membrane protein YphA (DoxX/SURF4 family)